MMARGYWLINFKRSEVRKFTEHRTNEDQFNKYLFIDNWKILGYLRKELPLCTTKRGSKNIRSLRDMEEVNISEIEKNQTIWRRSI